jgi:hypothetical protein
MHEREVSELRSQCQWIHVNDQEVNGRYDGERMFPDKGGRDS